jgi:uncharacterized membrane protein
VNWLKANWKSTLLVMSLAINLLVIGMVVAHGFMEKRGPGRIQATSWSQLLPRGFFMQLEDDRRQTLLDELKAHNSNFRKGRGELRNRAAAVAAALEAEPYDATLMAVAITQFGDEGKRLMDEGSAVALGVIGKLTPEERKILAAEIRKRAGGPGKQ